MIVATAMIIPAAGALQPTYAATTSSVIDTISVPPQRASPAPVPPQRASPAPVPLQRASPARAKPKTASTRRHRIGLLAVAKARKQIGKPYVWGATGPSAFDCSGLVQWAYRKAGKKLPRVTYAQYRAFRHHKVAWKHLAVGDLVFFYDKGHVGIVSKRKGKKLWMIHAPHTGSHVKQVRLDAYRKQTFSGAVRPF